MKKPFTTETTNPTHATLDAWPTAAETLEWLDTVIDDAGVEPSKAVRDCRADIAAIALDEQQELGDVELLRQRDGLDLSESVGLLSRAIAGTSTSSNDADRIEAASRILATDAPERARQYRHLQNQVHFYRARDAARRLRKLGDDILDGLLQPWIDRVMVELRPLAEQLAKGGWAQIYDAENYRRENLADDADITADIKEHSRFPGSVRIHYQTFRAIELTAELEHIGLTAHHLRERGVIARSADEFFAEVYYSFKNADNLPVSRYSAHTPHTAALWISQAIAAGCEPCARSAKQAEAARPKQPAEASL